MDETAFLVRMVGEVMLADQAFASDYRLTAACAGAMAGKPTHGVFNGDQLAVWIECNEHAHGLSLWC